MKISILKNRNFSLLLFGQFTSDLGGSIFEIALALFVLDLTGSATQFASILAVGLVPRMILYPFAGVIIDRFDRKKLIILLDILRGFFLIAVYILSINSSLNLLYVYFITFVLGLCETLFSPAIDTMIPFLFDNKDYEDAYSWNEMYLRISGIISPLLGAWLYTIIGIKMLILIDGVTFLLSAFSEVFIDIQMYEKTNEKFNIIKDMKTGFVELIKFKSVLYLTISSVLISIFIIPVFRIILPYFFKEVLGAPDFYIGVYRTLHVSGGIIGLTLVSSVKHKYGEKRAILLFSKKRALLFGLFIILGISPILTFLKLNPVYALIFVSILLFNIIIITPILSVFITSFRLRIVPKNLLGRFSTIGACLFSIGEVVGFNIFGLLLDNTPLSIPLIIVALGVVLNVFMVSKSLDYSEIRTDKINSFDLIN